MTVPTSAQGATQSRRARSVGIGRAHAKAILIGEHAVVYGAPALAVPIPQLTVTASAGWSSAACGGRGGVSYTMTGSPTRAMVTQASDGLRRLAAELMARMGVTGAPHVDVILDGAIPHGRGLGSSAASSRAVTFALADLLGRPLSESVAFDLVQTAENMAHGRASGVDARAVGASRPLLFQAGRSTELKLGWDGLFIVADSGEPGSTRQAVELLRDGFRLRPGARKEFVGRATQLAEAACTDLADGRPEQLGRRLTDYHALLRAAGVSTDRIEALVGAALGAGSLGAKITGGGLGGCVIALARPEQAREVTRRLHQAGAVQTWLVPLKGLDNHAQ